MVINMKNKITQWWNEYWYAYPKWNGILGLGSTRRKYFRKERIYHLLLIIIGIILTLITLFK